MQGVLPRLKKLICCLLMAAMASLSLPQAARAAMAETGRALDGAAAVQAERTRLRALLQRGEVQAVLAAHGVDPAEALARVEALSDREVALLAGRLSGLPAGAGTSEDLLTDPQILVYIVGAAAAIIILTVVLIGMGLDALFGLEDGEDPVRTRSSGGNSDRGK